MLDVVAANLGCWIVGFLLIEGLLLVVSTALLISNCWQYRNCDGSCSKKEEDDDASN